MIEEGPDGNLLKSGFLDVGDGHSIYWEEWGNPKAEATIFFHGGPGGGFHSGHKRLFNPLYHRVVFFDQRGAGQSTPAAELRDNDTNSLVEDTEKLRTHLSLGKVHLVGGSWGSTLALTYALKYTANVASLVLWGVYLGTKAENDLIATGYSRHNYPEAWERFISHVPLEERGTGRQITQYFANKIKSPSRDESLSYANEWTLWEASLVSLGYDKEKTEKETLAGDNLAIAKIETHYFLNDCFLDDNYILDNVSTIAHIPCYVVQGRFDNCTPPATAYALSKAYGAHLRLQFVSAGHSRGDAELAAALKAVLLTQGA